MHNQPSLVSASKVTGQNI